jgi:hypothetical protein
MGFLLKSSLLSIRSFIDFNSEIEFIKPTSTINAILVLMKDNPSDDPELSQSIFIPVILK